MLHNLCSCVSATITYILFFDSIVNEESKDFMVFSDLENKISTSFLEQLKPRMVMLSPIQYEAPAQMVNNCGQEQNGRLCNHGGGKLSNASKVGCACKTGHKSVCDYIQTTYGTTFNILRAPFKRTFLEKLSGLTRNYVPTFDHDEIMDIMMIFGYSKAGDLLAYAVVVYLMNNPGLVNQIQKHDSAKFNSPKLKQFYDLMFLTCDNGRSFSEIISSHIVLNLVDNNGETAKLHGSSECYDPIIIYADLHESLVNFLFPHLSLSFSFLERNQQILEKMVDNKIFCSYLRIEIHSIDRKVDGKSVEAFSSEQQPLSYQFNVLSTSKLVKCSYEVRLEFENYGDEGNCASFSEMKNLKSISCRSCSAKFISSIPEKIEVAMDVPDDHNVPTNIPMNTMQASFSDIIFTTDMTIPEQIKDIKISNCKFSNNAILFINERCDSISVTNTIATIVLPRIAGLNLVQLKSAQSSFKFIRNMKYHGKMLVLVDVDIVSEIQIDHNVNDMIFSSVKLTDGAKVKLDKKI